MNEKKYWKTDEVRPKDTDKLMREITQCLSAPDPKTYHQEKYQKSDTRNINLEDMPVKDRIAYCGQYAAMAAFGIGAAVYIADALGGVANALGHFNV